MVKEAGQQDDLFLFGFSIDVEGTLIEQIVIVLWVEIDTAFACKGIFKLISRCGILFLTKIDTPPIGLPSMAWE